MHVLGGATLVNDTPFAVSLVLGKRTLLPRDEHSGLVGGPHIVQGGSRDAASSVPAETTPGQWVARARTGESMTGRCRDARISL